MGRKAKYVMQGVFTEDGQVSEKPVREKESSKDPPKILRKGVTPMGRLSEYGTIDRSERALRLDDIAEQEVTITDFRLAQGDFGEYAFIDVTKEDGTEVTVITSGMFVIDALKDAKAKDALPVQAMFKKAGRAWVFV